MYIYISSYLIRFSQYFIEGMATSMTHLQSLRSTTGPARLPRHRHWFHRGRCRLKPTMLRFVGEVAMTFHGHGVSILLGWDRWVRKWSEMPTPQKSSGMGHGSKLTKLRSKKRAPCASVFPYAARYGSFEFQVLRAVKPEKAAMFTRMASRNTRPRGLETETMRMMEAIDWS